MLDGIRKHFVSVKQKQNEIRNNIQDFTHLTVRYNNVIAFCLLDVYHNVHRIQNNIIPDRITHQIPIIKIKCIDM
jgi:hypothetical protein